MAFMQTQNKRWPRVLLLGLGTVLFWALAEITPLALAESGRTPAGPPNPAEKYVLDQLAAGKVADLKVAFPDEAGRVVRGSFLEEVLTGARKDCSIHRNGVLIEGAIVREPVDLRNAVIAHDTRLVHCRFDGEVNLSKSVFENSFSIEGSIFQGPASFYAMKVGRGASLQNAVFGGHVDFSQVEITGVLMAGEARFEHPEGSAEFTGLKVGGNAFFTNAVFAGPVLFQYSHIADNFKLDGARFTNARALAGFETMKVAGSASFTGVSFAGYVSFKDANFNMLDLSSVRWPAHGRGEWLWLNGMTYQRITAGSENNSWSHLLQLLDRTAHRTAYGIDVYSGLVEFYRREGYPRQANLFFIAQKRRERQEVLHGMEWGWNLFLEWFVGYGRSPERALFWSTSIVLFGMGVFRPQRMEPRKGDAKPDPYSPFWYSVDLFLPLIKLQDVELWKPRDEARFARFWGRLHTMLGWALIPIALAAWTGMLGK